MTEISFRDNLRIHLDSVPQYEDLRYKKEYNHLLEPMMDYIDIIVNSKERDIEIDHRVFNLSLIHI